MSEKAFHFKKVNKRKLGFVYGSYFIEKGYFEANEPTQCIKLFCGLN